MGIYVRKVGRSVTTWTMVAYVFVCSTIFSRSVIQRDSKRWIHFVSLHGLNSKRRLNTRQLVAVFQVLCSLYGLTCVGYAHNSLEFVSRSPLIRVVGRSFCLYTDSLFAQIGDSNDKCSSSLKVEF